MLWFKDIEEDDELDPFENFGEEARYWMEL